MAARCVKQTEALNLAGGVWPNGVITGIWIHSVCVCVCTVYVFTTATVTSCRGIPYFVQMDTPLLFSI